LSLTSSIPACGYRRTWRVAHRDLRHGAGPPGAKLVVMATVDERAALCGHVLRWARAAERQVPAPSTSQSTSRRPRPRCISAIALHNLVWGVHWVCRYADRSGDGELSSTLKRTRNDFGAEVPDPRATQSLQLPQGDSVSCD
jgi:hypothetical protein